jgi:DNA invertase Pin-like site-specific DNA recombinase
MYARGVRSPEQSIEAQIQCCRAEARNLGLHIPDHLIFRDEGRNRYLAFDERPGLKALLDAARSEARPFDVVIVDANYRFSRPFQEMLSVYSALSRAGVSIRVAGTMPSTAKDTGCVTPSIYS